MFKLFLREKLKRRCNKLLNKHAYQEAFDASKQALEEFQNDPHFHIYQIWSLIELKKYDGAMEAASIGLQKFPDHQVILNLHGEVSHKLGLTEQALESLHKVHTESPDNLHTSYLLGQIYVAQGDLDLASKYFEEILQYDPKILQVRLLAMAEHYIYEQNLKQSA